MNDLCPQCRVLRDLQLQKKTVQKKAPDGMVKKVVIRSSFCISRGVFVKSEEIPVKGKALPRSRVGAL